MRQSIRLIILLSLFISVKLWAGPRPKLVVSHVYTSRNQEGLIGVTESSPSDNPADNIFHVQIDQTFCSEENVWLEYELEGVEDHTSVSRSINDHRSVGGHLVKKRRGWALQSERIDGTWLRQGDNIIRFTLPEGAQHSYRIRNLKITVGTSEESDEQVIINQPSSNYYDKSAYVKGFLPENNRENIRLKIDGKLVPVFKGEFESEINFEGTNCQVEMELVFPDGTTQCKTLTYGKMESADYHYAISSTVYYKEQFINTSKADSVSLQGAGLKLLPNALGSSTFLSITTLRDIDIPALDAGMVNVTANHYGYRFLPHGTQFLKETKLRIPFDATKIPDGYTDKDIRTYFFDEQTHHWIAVNTDTLLANTSEIISSTTHFTDYINAIIKVPESPEAEAYNSTSMKGIKAANPTAAVNLINPPQTNNTGSASLSYPINIPAGRNGMQPQLAISYSSAGGNGWLGLGWNLTVPSIGIETRWGVPRYDAAKETETYTMNGEMLTPVAHRGTLANRTTADKQFYPRIEGAFHKIIRHGNDPKTYWWEVTDKSGTRYFYGGSPQANGVENLAVLRDNEDPNNLGNIAHWALTETRDLNGNFVKYHYAKVSNTGLTNGTVPGYQLYIDNITYTGHNGIEGQYKVVFTRQQGRSDVTISANLGFKEVTADLLQKIDVQFQGKSVRSYVLNYKTGEFYKSLLNTISEYDAKGNLFNTHTLDYYDDVKSGAITKPFKKAEPWAVPNDGVKGDLIASKVGFDDKASAMGGNKSTDSGVGMTMTAGFYDGNLFAKSNTLGGSFGSSEGETDGKILMIDINGDGLSDKVMADGNGFRYRPNLSHGDTPKFGDPIQIQNADGFYHEKNTTTNYGFEAQAGFGAVNAFVGSGESKTTSVTNLYFTDVNGDGLPDLIRNGIAYFNHLDAQGVVSFTPSSANTPNPIFNSGTVASDIFQIDPKEVEAEIDAHPLHDVVRLWRAPYDGQISILGAVQLLNTGITAPNADGVQVSIQHNQNDVRWKQRISANDFAAHTPANVDNITVAKGDRIYFRVQSVFNGEVDLVQWSPVIEYVSKDKTLSDAHGNKLYRFNAQREFVLSSPMEVATPIAGTVRVESVFEKPKTNDSIHVEILHRTSAGTIVEFAKDFSWDEVVSLPVSFDRTVSSQESFSFIVKSKTNIDWPSIHWRPHLYYTASADPSVTELFRNGEPVISYYAVPRFSIHANALRITQSWVVDKKVDTIKVKPVASFNTYPDYDPFHPHPDPINGTFVFSVKKRDSLVAKQIMHVKDGTVASTDTLKIKTHKGDTLYFEYHAWNDTLAYFFKKAQASVKYNKKDSTIDAGVYTKYKQMGDVIYGTLYRQWGHFVYNGNRDRANNPINESDLKLSDKLNQSDPYNGDTQSPGVLGNAYSPAKDNFIMMFAKGKEQVWSGYDNLTYLNATQVSSSRMGADDLKPVGVVVGARGISKITKSNTSSISGGAGISVANASANSSNGKSHLVSDFMDLNGDRYPDIVTDKGVQYTNPTGELQSTYQNFVTGDITSTTTKSFGASAGGFVKIVPKGTPTNQKNTRSDVGSAKVSGTISVNYGEGTNTGDYSWQDINGDGLPDAVLSNGQVRLNLGYKLAAPEPWLQQGLQISHSKSEGAGLGFSVGAGSESASIAGGIGLSRSDNEIDHTLQDVNGDGLIDEVSLNGGVKVKLNTGNGFGNSQWQDWAGASRINFSSTTSESANASFTGCITFIVVPVKICFNPSGNAGESMSKDQVQMNDVDGDGFPDYLESGSDSELKVSRSTIGRTNLLKSVQRPLGASFTMNYHRMGNTYNLPHNVWVLDSVKVFDGFKGDGADEMLTTYAYENGKYDRHERESYGFAKVTTHTHDTQAKNLIYTTVTQTYANNNYYDKGLLLSETMTDGLGKKYVVKTNSYAMKDITSGNNLPPMNLSSDNGNAFPALTNTVQQFFEGQPTVGKTTSMQYEYSKIGNVITYTDNGDAGTEDDLKATIDYHTVEANYIMGTPKSIIVKNGNTVLRKRESVIDTNTGEVTQIKQYLDDKNVAVHDMQYDSYGNLIKMIRPANSTGQRLSIDYVYDGVVNMYPEKVSNSYGYSSSAKYDFSFGQKLSSTDINGNIINYTLDDLGRVATIIGPYENGGGSTSNYTIKFEYHPEAQVPYALTNHFDPQNPKNDLQTSIFVDGLGRVLQTKKDVAIFGGDGKADTEMMSVSGRVEFDAFGRTISAWYPVTETVGNPGEFNPTKDTEAKYPTLTAYDVMNRTLTVTLPDQSETKTTYGFDSDREGKSQFSTKTTDANGKQTEQFTDVRGRVTSVKNYTKDKPVWTSFKYSAINEQIEATDDLGHTTFSNYDDLGRRTMRKHPDAGITTYSYDLAGNLQQLVTANLAAAGMAINYTYDFERLMQITYPQNPENNVKYTYGAVGEKDNRVGRITLQEDATGAQEFFYGPLGEVLKNIRTVVIPGFSEQTFVTQWNYDTWNRLTSMVYPDGETVNYNYNLGGLLHDMYGKKASASFSYVNQLGYDKFEQRVFLAYGNGTKTTYNYEADRRRLKNMTAKTSAERSFMDNVYTYDKVNNILDLTNNAPVPAANLMGGPSEYKYSYDDLYRLTSATGNYKGANDEESYTLAMSYNSVGGITQKNQAHLKKAQVQKKTTYDNAYAYGDTQPHAPIHIGTQTYTYDANGNQLGWRDDKTGQRRNIFWDEENRIRAIEDNGSFFHYVYDASGERVLKGQSSGQRIFVNGQWKSGSGQMGNFAVYVNPYIVLKSGGYTKHFYIEGQRIVSKLGGGWDNNGQGPLKPAGNGKIDFNSKRQQLSDGIVKNLKFLGADGQILTAGKSGKIPPGQINGTGNITEAFRYFFHPDHLGSTSYITDASGEVYQHLEYFAFGETFVDEHSNTNRTPYLFNGKELDEETGLYYYGARYYDSRTSVWQSVDPLADKMPGWSSYNYTFNNPIRFIDHEGHIPLPKVVDNVGMRSGFGIRVHPITGKLSGHGGVDLGTNGTGHPVRVLADGIVEKIGWDVKYDEKGNKIGYGRFVVVKHKDGYRTLYGHLEENGVIVKEGQSITDGMEIAKSGNTGGSTGPHLHVEIAKGDIFDKKNKIDPTTIDNLQTKLHGEKLSDKFSLDNNISTKSIMKQDATRVAPPQKFRPDTKTYIKKLDVY